MLLLTKHYSTRQTPDDFIIYVRNMGICSINIQFRHRTVELQRPTPSLLITNARSRCKIAPKCLQTVIINATKTVNANFHSS